MPDSGSDDFLCVCNTGRCECSCGQYGNAGCLQCDRSPEKQKQREVNANWIKKDQEKEIDKDKNTPYNEDKFQQAKPLKFSVCRNFIRPELFDSLGRLHKEGVKR